MRAVYVDGQRVVENGGVLTMDDPAAAAALHEAQARVKATTVPRQERDYRTAELVSRPAFRTQ